MKTVSNWFAMLDEAIIAQAKLDLIGPYDGTCLDAVLYFFLDGAGVDEKLPRTFTHLCIRNGIDPEKAARGIWDQLEPQHKSRILRLLEEIGFWPTKTIN